MDLEFVRRKPYVIMERARTLELGILDLNSSLALLLM